MNKALKRLHLTPTKIIIFDLFIAAGDGNCRIARDALCLIHSLQLIMLSLGKSTDVKVFPAVFRFPGKHSMYVQY